MNKKWVAIGCALVGLALVGLVVVAGIAWLFLRERAPIAPRAVAKPVATANDRAELRLEGDSGLVLRLRGSQIIGRADSCSLTLDSLSEAQRDEVSRLHAALVFDGERWTVTDLRSTNGTFVNGVDLMPYTASPLSDGDRLAIAGSVFQFHVLRDEAPPGAEVRFDPGKVWRDCDGGSAVDCAVAGAAYRTGAGVAKDDAKADALFVTACRARFEPACLALIGRIEITGPKVPPQQ